jgi:hypothetical protein
LKLLQFAAIAFALAAGPAEAQTIPPISLEIGEAVTVWIEEGGEAGDVQRYRANWSRFDVATARHYVESTPPEAPVGEGKPFSLAEASPDPIPQGQIRIRFLSIADRHALLVVENGHGLALSYRAQMTTDGETRPTDVCIVLPQRPSYEYWPHPIARIELSDFRFLRWDPGRPVPCA